MLFCSLLNMKKKLSIMGLFLCLSRISLGRYCLENVVKCGCWEKRYKGGGGGGWLCRGLSIEEVCSNRLPSMGESRLEGWRKW